MLRVGSAAEAGERGWWKVAAFEVLDRVGTPVSDDEGRRRGLVWVMAMLKKGGLGWLLVRTEVLIAGGRATGVSQSESCLDRGYDSRDCWRVGER